MGLHYRTEDKVDLFADSLESSFQENPEPYDDDFIDHVEERGSNLSSLLYSLYTHDFPTTPTVEVCLFAHDAAIIALSYTPERVQKILQSYLTKLKRWLTLWRISVNTSKSQAIIFKKENLRSMPNPLKLFPSTIPWCDEVSYPGVTLDKKLTYRSHILQIAEKFKTKLHSLHRLLSRKSKLNLDTKKKINLPPIPSTGHHLCLPDLGNHR
ncbi:putative RNA-directed DNA polymerase from transposon BS [Trichonephila inaurata madagascariensis]|uniref:Putative RNA-directed DNA polymerase from transposon BS n=1 Tax=Trichonephila inaurata madagascariensis TaxID=2747483 RepID=A0A8X6X7I5_9ARAC|nr:putative RNA-directed DNA polymerase from transposon BS [Trichonephila inaurata madagascariensis]